jgi:hypothetical protein
MKTTKQIALLSCLAAIIGSFLPWLSGTTIFGTMNVAGTDGDGVITLVLGLLAAVFLYLGTSHRIIVFASVCLWLGVLVVALELNHLRDKIAAAPDEIVAHVGYGLYICAIGFILGGIMSIRLYKETSVESEVEELVAKES